MMQYCYAPNEGKEGSLTINTSLSSWGQPHLLVKCLGCPNLCTITICNFYFIKCLATNLPYTLTLQFRSL